MTALARWQQAKAEMNYKNMNNATALTFLQDARKYYQL
jgi:hypothetical protein